MKEKGGRSNPGKDTDVLCTDLAYIRCSVAQVSGGFIGKTAEATRYCGRHGGPWSYVRSLCQRSKFLPGTSCGAMVGPFRIQHIIKDHLLITELHFT